MDRDTSILQHILKHTKNIDNTLERFGSDYNTFKSDIDFFNSVCMSILQIGELTNHLSINIREKYSNIPWGRIIGLRNIVVHGYGQLDTELVWATAIESVPVLADECNKIIIEKTK
jgi:uncharacterized protein with HEPN domain